MKAQFTVVFSAWCADQDLIANMEASKRARSFLTELDLPHWDAVGAFKELGHDTHTQEVSHVVHCEADDVQALMSYACAVYNQDCVLVIKSDDNTASLESPSNSVDLGKLVQVTEAVAKHNQCYTYFLGDYYICQ